MKPTLLVGLALTVLALAATPADARHRHFRLHSWGRAMISAAAYVLVASFVLATSAAQAQSAQDFVNKVALSDMFEIQSSQLALTKQPDADTKPFAEKMISDHHVDTRRRIAAVRPGWLAIRVSIASATDTNAPRVSLRHETRVSPIWVIRPRFMARLYVE